jgi:hypothetical protein
MTARLQRVRGDENEFLGIVSLVRGSVDYK